MEFGSLAGLKCLDLLGIFFNKPLITGPSRWWFQGV